MKNLIKPTLFIITRLGLLLAVSAWVVGLWQVFGTIAGPFSIASGPGGWEICRWDSSNADRLSFFSYSAAVEVPHAPSSSPRLWGMFVYHWLVVSIFALFYGMLKWAYRKRGNGRTGTGPRSQSDCAKSTATPI